MMMLIKLVVGWLVLPILLWRESRAAAAVTVDLFDSAADIIVADVQHVEARTCAVHQGGAVQKTKTAFRKCSLQTHTNLDFITKNGRNNCKKLCKYADDCKLYKCWCKQQDMLFSVFSERFRESGDAVWFVSPLGVSSSPHNRPYCSQRWTETPGLIILSIMCSVMLTCTHPTAS